jgi:uncharacterized alkaline shock family protein YloU
MSIDAFLIRRAEGTITVTSAALQRLVIVAAESVDGARVRRPRRGLTVSIGGNRADVSLELAARDGVVLPELGRGVQERVAEALRAALDLDVARVDVSVEEVE